MSKLFSEAPNLLNKAFTVVPNWESIKPCLCSKFPLASWIIFTISESFPKRYCVTLYLNGYQKYDRLKLKVLILSIEFWSFNFDLWYFWSPVRYRFIQSLIRELSDMVKMIWEDKFVATLSTSIRAFWKVGIYFINRALLILNLAPL